VIVRVQATAARKSQETVAAQNMLTRFAEGKDEHPERGRRRYDISHRRLQSEPIGYECDEDSSPTDILLLQCDS
jgi:hypothetical protein